MALGFSHKTTTVVFLITTCLFVTVFFGAISKYRQRGNFSNAEPRTFTDPTLEFVAVLFRHGERVPTFEYKTDPHANAFPEGQGELTKKGKQHMYKTGQFFRRIYDGYISYLYLDSEILMKTANLTRTYMSAAMVLTGMYPPKSYQKWSDSETVWQPIPIYYESPDHGALLAENGKCPSFDLIFREYTQSVNSEMAIKNKKLLSYLSEKCGQPIVSSIDLIQLQDLFFCQIADGLQLPEWAKPDLIETIKTINQEHSTTLLGKNRVQNFIAGPLLREITSNIELRSNISNHNTTKKMHIYSGHDLTVASIMGFLIDFITIPGFGGSLHFHLYHNKTNGYIVKMFYYNQWDDEVGKEVYMPKCGNPCKVQDFIKLVKDNIPQNWEEECQKLES